MIKKKQLLWFGDLVQMNKVKNIWKIKVENNRKTGLLSKKTWNE